MITSFKATSGFLSELKCVKDRKFEFQPGINILFGPNGSGKSSILRTMSAHCFIDKFTKGWSSIPKPIPSVSRKKKHEVVKEIKSIHSPKGCAAEIDWDGTASFHYEPDASDAIPPSFGMENDGLSNDLELARQMIQPASSGEVRLVKASKLYDMVKNKKFPDLSKIPDKWMNSTWQDWGKAITEYIQSKKPSGIPTILMDEPDRSLSIISSRVFWTKAVINLAKFSQIIVSTHCPFAILFPPPGANFIDMEPGYIDQCTACFSPDWTFDPSIRLTAQKWN